MYSTKMLFKLEKDLSLSKHHIKGPIKQFNYMKKIILFKKDESTPENIEEIEISKENPESQLAQSENEPNNQIETNLENLDELESLEPDESRTTPNDSLENELIQNEENTSTCLLYTSDAADE